MGDLGAHDGHPFEDTEIGQLKRNSSGGCHCCYGQGMN